MNLSSAETIARLQQKMEQIGASQGSGVHARVPTGAGALDALFPGGGMRRGMIVELLSAAEGAGAWTLGLVLASKACDATDHLVVVDGHSWFYPPAASRLGIDLRRCLVIRPESWRDAYTAVAQSLQCSAVGGVVCWCQRIATADYQRLRLAAESGRGLGVLIRPLEELEAPTRASVRLQVSPIASGEPTRQLRVDVLRGRGCGQALILELHDEADHVHLSARLAHPAASSRPASAAE